MTEKQLQEIIDRYLNGYCSPEEKEFLDSLFDVHIKRSAWEPLHEIEGLEIEGRLLEKLRVSMRENVLKSHKKRTNFLLRVAASITLILGIGLVIYLNQLRESEVNYITKSSTRGQKATITLSDGSVVRLNSESSITYPETFASLDSRDIKLTGEAFFEVKRNQEKPFSIKSADILTTVLGTSFNISAYPETDEIEVTVATGQVKVESDSDLVSELVPGQQASYSKLSNALTVSEVDVNSHMAWKDGMLLFDKASFPQVVMELERWYGVDIEVEGEARGCQIVGRYKNQSLENILNGLSQTLNLKIVNGISNEKIILKVEPCK